MPSKAEIDRQYRVLRQTLSMHSMLAEKYAMRAMVVESVILVVSVAFCATTFAEDSLYKALHVSPDQARIALGILSIAAFASSLLLMTLQWRQRSAQHSDAADRWSNALERFREAKSDTGSWPDSLLQELSDSYWEADRNSVKIPTAQFSKLKSRYLLKVAVSELQSAYPGCPRLILAAAIRFRDFFRVIKSNGSRKPDPRPGE